ncbi:MAG TPA: hypothetical protein VFJ98_06135, partial [Mycobacteriales bacterium]|nr:hypothetical protein [Mycobacteriales bacterium]
MGEISLQQGHAVPVDLDADGRVVATGGWGDSGLWTGVYAGGEALRYAVAKKHLAQALAARHGSDPAHPDEGQHAGTADLDAAIAFWTAQRDEAFGRLRTILAAEHRDITIAEDWTGTLKVPPGVNPAGYPLGDDKHLADFGGGVVKGQAGMIMRACTPVGLGRLGVGDPAVDPAQPVNDNSNRVFRIKWTHGDGRTYNCETSPSRDTYAGLTFGLLTAYDMLGRDAPALTNRIRADLVAMGEFLFKYAWTYPRPHGYVSASHDFDGFFSPLFVQVPMARLNLVNAVRHVLADSTDTVAKARWTAIWAEELASQGPLLAGSMEVDSLQPNDGYYKFNLHHLTGFNLLRTTSGAERTLFAQAFGVLDKTTGDDLNAHFEAITYSMTGETSRLDAAVKHLRQWRQYKANVESGAAVRNSLRCGQDITCVPQDLYGVETPAGEVDWFPGTSASLRAARPLPVAQRAPTDFLWQRPPTALDGQEPATHREPAIDYLTPYWMLRYFTEVARPALSPFPTWPGPAHV